MENNKTTTQTLVAELARRAETAILPLIDRDYVLYALPYYTNIGDTLIWEGELELLKKSRHKCVGVCGWNDYPAKPVAEDVLILITGGGFFGDLWRNAWQGVLDGIKGNVNNKIIFLPQSVYYQDQELLQRDVQYLSQFKHLTICTRDTQSFDYVKRHFPSHTSLLVPDMAFCISPVYLQQWVQPSSEKTLLLKRQDKELVDDNIVIPETNVDVHDWPTMESVTRSELWFYRIERRVTSLRYRVPFLRPLMRRTKDWMYRRFYRRMMTKRGVAFVSSYRNVYTTRLHVMVLAVLLDKEVHIIDNSYGKISALYHTWLEDCEKVSIFQPHN